MEDEEEYNETEAEEATESRTNEEEQAQGEESSESPPQETFRQGYGSGRRRSTTSAPSSSGRFGGRGGFERRGRGGGGYGRREGYGGGGRRDRGFDRDRGPVPVEEGQELTLTIDALGRRGDGIARINNFVIFVPGAQAGDQVKVRITTVRGSFATGEIVS